MNRIKNTARAAATVITLIVVTTLPQCTGDDARPNGSPPNDHGTTPTPPAEIIGERIRLLISGSMDGRLEPCGCASGQLGGLPRRLAHAQEVHGYDLLIEGGDLVRGNTPLDIAKAETAVQALFAMPQITANIRNVAPDSSLVGPYHALGLSPRDLELPLDEFYGGFVSAFQVPVVASDLESTAGMWPARSFLEYDVRGTAVRIASLTLGLPEQLQGGEAAPLVLLEPDAAWRRALQGASDETVRVLMIHGKSKRVRELTRQLQPRPDLVIGIGSSYLEPPGSAEDQDVVPIVFPGIRGLILLDVALARTARGSTLTVYEPIALRGSETKPGAGEDPSVRLMLLEHRKQVAEDDIQEQMAEQLPAPKGLAYIGSEQCRTCHAQDYEIWQRSKHATAWTTLEKAEVERYHAPVTQYPDCISCHVVGFREKTGFINKARTPQLAGVGCERCHGPGSAHMSDPQVKMGKVGDGLPSIVCTQCHDFEQSPDFDYRLRWSMIEHGK